MTASQTLFNDMQRDIAGYDPTIKLMTMHDLNDRSKEIPDRGILQLTYSVFMNKSDVVTMLEWMGPDFSGCVSFLTLLFQICLCMFFINELCC